MSDVLISSKVLPLASAGVKPQSLSHLDLHCPNRPPGVVDSNYFEILVLLQISVVKKGWDFKRAMTQIT